jgi:hypothetical protein
MRRAILLCALVLPAAAAAHGGLPVSETILPQGEVLLVPTLYWGVFFGQDGGPWRWICEEAINRRQDRAWAFTGDGTYHVTDFAGITSSSDGGCTWVSATGEIAARSTSSVVADPADGKRAWATSDSGTMQPWNALFTTVDDGLTWTPVLKVDEILRGVALSSDGKTLYVVGVPRANGPQTPILHVSTDGGMSFTDHPIQYTLKGIATTQIVPIAVDPASSQVAYFKAVTDPTRALLRTGDGGATLEEQLQVDGDIGGMAFDADRKSILVATGKGLRRTVSGGGWAPAGNLSRAQCIRKVGAALYACSWNYAPDNAAIARSDDGGDTFVKVFQYADTVGVTASCPAATPVGMICPGAWQSYADQLGIMVGGPDMAGPPPPPSCHCSLHANPGTGTGTGTGTILAGFLFAAWTLRRKICAIPSRKVRRRARRESC